MIRIITLWLVLFIGAPSVADEVDTKIGRLQSDLRGLTRDISNLGRESTDSGDVEKVAREVYGLIDDLIDLLYIMDDDHFANQIIDGYPESMDTLIEALTHMEQLKELSGTVGEEATYCEDNMARDMPAELRDVLADSDTDVRDLENLAKGYAAQAQGFIETAEEHVKEMDDRRREVRSFRANHRDFNALFNALFEAADDTVDNETDWLEEVQEACEIFVDWEDHPAYKDAEDILIDEAQAIKDFVDDADTWVKSGRNIDEAICDSLRLVRDAYCQKDWEPGNENDLRLYDSLADRTAKDFRNRLNELVRDYERTLRSRGQTLAPRDNEAERSWDIIRPRHDYFRALIYGRPLLGANHPKVRVWRSYGVEQHIRMQRDEGCNIGHPREHAIPGLSGRDRPDCVVLDDCAIIEFKPNTPSGRADGAKVSIYVNSLNRWIKSAWPDVANDPVPSRRDSTGMEFDDDFLLQARAWECIESDGTPLFSGFVMTYDPCDRDQELMCKP